MILAIDVSGSMRANDVEPTRIEAAQAAARAFITQQPRSTRIGVVAFAGSAALVQPPTSNRHGPARRHRSAAAAARHRGRQRHPGLAEGDLPAEFDCRLPGSAARRSKPFDCDRCRPAPTPRRRSSCSPTARPPPDPTRSTAARLAAERGVRVFTVGVGTDNGQILNGEGWSMRVRLDEERAQGDRRSHARRILLRRHARLDLKKVYQSLRSKLVMEKKQTEITAIFSALAAAAVLLSATLSLLWFNRIL